MKVILLVVGKTEDKYLLEGIDKYCKRLKHYLSFEIQTIPALKNTKNLTQEQQKIKEGELILKSLQNNDQVILMDEKGKNPGSVTFANQLNTWFNRPVRQAGSNPGRLVFIIGGPYGFDQSVYARSNGMIALSAMTFSHQMVRLIFVEQLYRAMTILKNEPYHHQ